MPNAEALADDIERRDPLQPDRLRERASRNELTRETGR
jgi:hypothetical protein